MPEYAVKNKKVPFPLKNSTSARFVFTTLAHYCHVLWRFDTTESAFADYAFRRAPERLNYIIDAFNRYPISPQA